jgi:glycosyltransferase involved in cell wall biosynthesis
MPVKNRILYFLQDALEGLLNALVPGRGAAASALGREQPGGKRVVIACSHFWPSVGGLESRVEMFSSQLVLAGYQVTVLTLDFPGRTSDLRNGVRIQGVIPGQRIGFVHSWPYAVRRAVRSGRYDACILIQDPQCEIIWSMEGGTPPPGTRLIIQPIINADGYARWRDNARFSGGLAGIMKSAAAAVVMTRSGPDTTFMADHGIPSVYIPNATVVAAPDGNFRTRHGIPAESFLILHVANLYWVKNHLGLLESLHRLPACWKLVLIGNPTGEPECAQAVGEALAGRPEILYLPGLNRDGVSSAMAEADVMVLSSLGEGAPNTILEAMAHAKPWLATPECGAANDHAGGIICPLADFFAHLSVLQDSPTLRAQLGAAGYRHWQEALSWPQVIDAWIGLIEARNPAGGLREASGTGAEMKRLKEAVAGRVSALKAAGREKTELT